MYIIFNNKNHILFRWRLFFYTIISLIIIIFDIKFNILFKIHNYINYSPLILHYLTEVSNQWIKSITYSVNNQQRLITENIMLKKSLFIMSSELLLTEHYKQENKKLRKLLSAPILNYKKKILAEVISNKINLFTSQVIINKGTNHGVHIGQAVINDKGVIGQVIATNALTSAVLLICDISHALPVQTLRNHIRMILKGNGYNNYLQLKYSSTVNNIKIGDTLITSGLDGRFPTGYPVAIITSIITNCKSGRTIMQAYPIAQLNHLSYLILLSNTEKNIP